MFDKILIANRGEIACRILRTARALGYRTVAVYSAADAGAPHVMLADEAVAIGAAPAAESYLCIDKLIAAARQTGANAIHPGYGFLSENAAFAQACAEHALVFIGPPPDAIRLMGNKALAKALMQEAGVPTAPGYLGADQSDARLSAEAQRLGYPLLVKAVAGGGGRGIRTVQHADELAGALAGARREAMNAFGDGTLMLERLIADGRHIEIQIFADAHGNAVHLGERDCTTQRRRQKVIEEAPSPVLTPALRARMGQDAVAAALAVGYRGAGTIEFMLDQDMQHYFLEMNTRLQVEHPVTEMLTGLDLVEWQILVAAGAALPLAQADIRFHGHAIEARLYAEDPYHAFAPQTGEVAWWEPAAAAAQPGIRIEHGIRSGSMVTPYYDAMVAKVIAHGRDRSDAIRRLSAALENAPLLGIPNNARFLRDLLRHESFRQAAISTTTLDHWSAQAHPLLQRPAPSAEIWCLAAAVLAAGAQANNIKSDSVAAFELHLNCGAHTAQLRVRDLADGSLQITHEGQPRQIRLAPSPAGSYAYQLDGVLKRVAGLRQGEQLYLAPDACSFCFSEVSPYPAAGAAAHPGRVLAPVAGIVSQILVQPGASVSAGQQLACVEAMKMEMWLCARMSGTVSLVHSKIGDQVKAKALMMELEPSD